MSEQEPNNLPARTTAPAQTPAEELRMLEARVSRVEKALAMVLRERRTRAVPVHPSGSAPKTSLASPQGAKVTKIALIDAEVASPTPTPAPTPPAASKPPSVPPPAAQPIPAAQPVAAPPSARPAPGAIPLAAAFEPPLAAAVAAPVATRLATPVATPAASATVHAPLRVQSRWLLLDASSEFLTVLRMFFDHRYRVSFAAWLVPAIALTLMIISWLILPGFLDRIVMLLLAYVVYKVLMRDANRYREIVRR